MLLSIVRGVFTRIHKYKKTIEKSVLDYVFISSDLEEYFTSMQIDEEKHFTPWRSLKHGKRTKTVFIFIIKDLFYRTCSRFQNDLFHVVVRCNHFTRFYVCALVSVCISFTRDQNENKVFAICIMPSLPASFQDSHPVNVV